MMRQPYLHCILGILSWLLSAQVWAESQSPNIAFFYGANAPWNELRVFDYVVIEPQYLPDPKLAPQPITPIARITLTDQAEQQINPLWQAGYRIFLLDGERANSSKTITQLTQRFPNIRLLLNSNFDVVSEVQKNIFAIISKPLFQSWNASAKKYEVVSEGERNNQLQQLEKIKQLHIPIISLEYVAAQQRDLARSTAKSIASLGVIPWVTTNSIDILGVGNVEVMPRKVLIINNNADDEYALYQELPQRFAAMPLNYLGYSIEYADARKPLPESALTGRYAGVLVWLARPISQTDGNKLANWLEKQTSNGVKVVVFEQANFLLNSPVAARLGLKVTTANKISNSLTIKSQDNIVGFEIAPKLEISEFRPLKAEGGTSLLQLANERNETQDAIAIMPWGGYALNTYAIINLPMNAGSRWVIQPIEFMRRAFNLPDIPVPDTTTETGRRMLLAHIDGDAFVSKVEIPGAPYAGETLRDRILKKYRIPTTMSVIQGEIAENGLYPELSPKLEAIARDIFALPHIEAASHSYSHPFDWKDASTYKEQQYGGKYRLAVPNYYFDLKSEINGSMNYIKTRLVPANKPVSVFLWTGTCNPSAEALGMIEKAGFWAMNGGETLITRSSPTLTLIAPLGIPKKGYFQVFAPNQNENLYTNEWTGPFYGYKRVIETFEMTDTPYRLKPINIYYHSYAATKVASLDAMDTVYQWAMSQETTPLFVSDYVRKVHDFNKLVIARSPTGWLIRGTENLRQFRAPSKLGQPDINSSKNLIGYNQRGEEHYLHLSATESEIRFTPNSNNSPYLVSANARVESAKRNSNNEFSTILRVYMPLEFKLANVHGCNVQANGKVIKANSVTDKVSHYAVPNNYENTELKIRCAQ